MQQEAVALQQQRPAAVQFSGCGGVGQRWLAAAASILRKGMSNEPDLMSARHVLLGINIGCVPPQQWDFAVQKYMSLGHAAVSATLWWCFGAGRLAQGSCRSYDPAVWGGPHEPAVFLPPLWRRFDRQQCCLQCGAAVVAGRPLMPTVLWYQQRLVWDREPAWVYVGVVTL